MTDPEPLSDAESVRRLADPATRDAAAQVIHQKYAKQMLAHVQRHLSVLRESRSEPDDIMQSVWKSFFSKDAIVLRGDSLFPLLAAMSARKAISAIRKESAEKRCASREVEFSDDAAVRSFRPSEYGRPPRSPETYPKTYPESNAVPARSLDDSATDQDVLRLMARGATPQQAAIAIEMFQALPSELQEIMAMILEGFTDDEIAAHRKVVRRTIVRKSQLIARELKKMSES